MHLRDYDLNLLTVFDTVMTTGSASKAAEVLQLTNAAISQSLSRLRDAVGEQLFVRDGRGLKPTQFALNLHRQVAPALQDISFALDASIHFEPAISHQHFVLSSMSIFESVLMPYLLNYTYHHAPQIKIDMRLTDDSPEITVEKLVARECDLAINSVLIDNPDISQVKAYDERTVCVCAADHPRIQGRLSKEQWSNEWHAALRGKRAGMQVVSSLMLEEAPARRIHYQADSLLTLVATSAVTELLVMCGQRMANQWADKLDIQILDIPYKMRPLPVYLCWHQKKDSDAGLLWFKQRVTEALQLYSSPPPSKD